MNLLFMVMYTLFGHKDGDDDDDDDDDIVVVLRGEN